MEGFTTCPEVTYHITLASPLIIEWLFELT